MTTTPTMPPAPATSLPALDRWVAFATALADASMVERLDTEDVVAALLDRSLIEEDLQAGAFFDDADLLRLLRADQHYRGAAASVLDHTDIALFTDDEPPTHWWWHVEQLVLGHAGEQLLNVPDAASLKGVHPHTVRAAIKDGRLPARRLARGFLVHRRDLERWQPRSVGRPKGRRATRTSDTVLESFNDANTNQDWDKAAQLAAAMERDPTSPRRCLAVALVAFNAGEDAKAESWAARALDGELPIASRQTALLVQGRALLREGRTRKALRVLRSAHEVGFSDWTTDSALAEAYLESNESRRAVEVAERAVAQAPEVPEVRYLLARMLWHDDRPWDALEHVVRFRERRPAEVDAVLLHGSILGYLGDLTGRSHLYQRSREVVELLVRDGLLEAIAIDGQALGNLGKWKAAFRSAKKLLAMAGEEEAYRHSAWHVIQAAVDATRERSERETILERALAILEQSEYLADELALVRAVQGDVEGTIAALGTTMERLHHEKPHARMLVVAAMLNAERGPEAFALLEPLTDQLDEAAMPFLVDAAIRAGDMNAAVAAYRRVAEIHSDLGRMADLGLRLLELGQASARAEALEHAASQRPTIAPWFAGQREQPRTARESGWEGPHRRTSRVLDEASFGRVH